MDVVSQLSELGFREVALIGGEFYLREDWDQIAQAITDAGMLCTMVTGGRGLTKGRVERASNAGVALISVSVDGLRETHDVTRWRRPFTC